MNDNGIEKVMSPLADKTHTTTEDGTFNESLEEAYREAVEDTAAEDKDDHVVQEDDPIEVAENVQDYDESSRAGWQFNRIKFIAYKIT